MGAASIMHDRVMHFLRKPEAKLKLMRLKHTAVRGIVLREVIRT
jgi:hypothetical protein